MIAVTEAAAEISVVHVRSEGCTFSLHSGNLAGRRLFSVAVGNTVSIDGGLVAAPILVRFIEDNLGILTNPLFCVGTWFDKRQNVSLIEISQVYQSPDQAAIVAASPVQEAIYDLADGNVLWVKELLRQ